MSRPEADGADPVGGLDRSQAAPVDRREFLELAALGTAAIGSEAVGAAPLAPVSPTSGDVRQVAHVTLVVNGEAHTLAIEPRTTLLDTLRENLALTGTKKSCDRGECGACTVHSDGRRILSCMSLAVMQDGRQITTIEGLAADGRLSPVQAAFVAQDGMQCGFCTSGQIMSATAMLDEVRDGWASAATSDVTKSQALSSLPRSEIQERMSGNLCRCACYPNIVDAVAAAARKA